jgi:hypothetical protein
MRGGSRLTQDQEPNRKTNGRFMESYYTPTPELDHEP